MNTIVRLGLGGRGGGAVRVAARHIFVDGKLTANGENGAIYAGMDKRYTYIFFQL